MWRFFVKQGDFNEIFLLYRDYLQINTKIKIIWTNNYIDKEAEVKYNTNKYKNVIIQQRKEVKK